MQPLNDIFAPSSQKKTSPIRGVNGFREQRLFKVAKDADLPEIERRTKLNNDSGYHGLTEDEMDVDEQATLAKSGTPRLGEKPGYALLDAPKTRQSREQSVLDSSFHSAKEDITREASKESSTSHAAEAVSPQAQAPETIESAMGPSFPQPHQTQRPDDIVEDSEVVDKASLLDEDVGNDSLRSQSEGSSPAVKGLVRKSSLTFATLPAREPLTTKKSIGARLSRTSHVEAAKGVMSRGSFLGRMTGGKSLGGSRQPEIATESQEIDDMDIDYTANSKAGHEESDGEAKTPQLHNKSSTQRLHDRINMLGKSQPARPTKSIPAATTLSHPIDRELPHEPATGDIAQRSSEEDEDDDDWIQPPSKQSPRPQLSKSISADVMENLRGKTNIGDEQFGRKTTCEQQQSPRRHSLDSGRDSLNIASTMQIESHAAGSQAKANQAGQTISSTTPVGTPVLNRHADGPISASKSKLQSIMKTARGLFTSSAGASAQAKMELRNQAKFGSPNIPSPTRPLNKEADTGLYPSLAVDSKNTLPAARPENLAKPLENRRTRGSIEKERKEKERQRADEELRRMTKEDHLGSNREQGHNDQHAVSDELSEMSKIVPVQPRKSPQQPTRKSPRRLQDQQDTTPSFDIAGDNTENTVTGKVSQPPPGSQHSQVQKPREMKRPVKPAKEIAPKPEPQRVAIRVGTLSQRVPLSNAALSSGLQDSLPPPPRERPGLTKKTSTASIQTSASSTSLRSAVTSKPKALIAAEKKKEQVSAL